MLMPASSHPTAYHQGQPAPAHPQAWQIPHLHHKHPNLVAAPPLIIPPPPQAAAQPLPNCAPATPNSTMPRHDPLLPVAGSSAIVKLSNASRMTEQDRAAYDKRLLARQKLQLCMIHNAATKGIVHTSESLQADATRLANAHFLRPLVSAVLRLHNCPQGMMEQYLKERQSEMLPDTIQNKFFAFGSEALNRGKSSALFHLAWLISPSAGTWLGWTLSSFLPSPSVVCSVAQLPEPILQLLAQLGVGRNVNGMCLPLSAEMLQLIALVMDTRCGEQQKCVTQSLRWAQRPLSLQLPDHLGLPMLPVHQCQLEERAQGVFGNARQPEIPRQIQQFRNSGALLRSQQETGAFGNFCSRALLNAETVPFAETGPGTCFSSQNCSRAPTQASTAVPKILAKRAKSVRALLWCVPVPLDRSATAEVRVHKLKFCKNFGNSCSLALPP